MTSFQSILQDFRKNALSEREKGEQFERLMKGYLQTDPLYHFQKVWLWNEFPAHKELGGTDTGIDLVAKTQQGDYWAVQCKFYKEGTIIDKPELDSFLATSSREFADENGQRIGFAQRLWIDTTGKDFGINAEKATQNQNPPFSKCHLHQLEQSAVDWEKIRQGMVGKEALLPQKRLFPHQQKALDAVIAGFETADRGKLIMACGTGKTFTSLKIAENFIQRTYAAPLFVSAQTTAGKVVCEDTNKGMEVVCEDTNKGMEVVCEDTNNGKDTNNGRGLILFLVPSIALLGQSLREWVAQAERPIHAICICSDEKVSKKVIENDEGDISTQDLAMPASTDVPNILKQFEYIKSKKNEGMTVVFSTYHSIQVIVEVQVELLKKDKSENPFGVFDLIICDEAHRTTGVTLKDEEKSAFVKVHDNEKLKARKRMYMTATPRLYADDAKKKADRYESVLCDMNDEKLYGKELYRIGFGEAVEQNLLTDYKVLILTLNEAQVPQAVQQAIADGEEHEINTDELSKILGCINAFSKQIIEDDGTIAHSDPAPMRRIVAFCSRIDSKNGKTGSKEYTEVLNKLQDSYYKQLPPEQQDKTIIAESRHVDGTMSIAEREEHLRWLKQEQTKTCRVLTNARCLSEGVDVPSLDAVVFFASRDSQVDVVQSVGRVMRKAPNKKYGYIIIPIVLPSNVAPDQALDDNKRYKIVWDVLNALRTHDERFDATINSIELNRKKPNDKIIVTEPKNGTENQEQSPNSDAAQKLKKQLDFQFTQLQGVIYAKIVQKVGNRRYWENWAKDVSLIAEKYIDRIHTLLKRNQEVRNTFEEFVKGLHKNINPAISQADAIEMLAQHLITKPVFEAMFEEYSFAQNNPVSMAMQSMIDVLQSQIVENELDSLEKFYESIRKRAAQIDNAEGKQKVIIELYDKFFKNAFPKMVEKLGIVYTPTEVVDFIIHSVESLLQKEFGRSLSDENIHILDPFTGTGTFMVRLLQSGIIQKQDLFRKYTQELHANEIVLLAYYIAAINIENAFFDLNPAQTLPEGEQHPTQTLPLGRGQGGGVAFKKRSCRVDLVQNQNEIKNFQ